MSAPFYNHSGYRNRAIRFDHHYRPYTRTLGRYRTDHSSRGLAIDRNSRSCRRAGGALAIGGGFAIADAVRGQMSAERAAALLSNSATIGGKTPAGATTPEILARASIISKETGTDKGEIIGAVQNYVAKSSDFAGGMANAGFFAKLAKASGTRLEDITGAAGILRAQNKGLSADDMKQMLLDLVEQGKQGAVEINDLAHLAGGLGSTRGLYKGSQTENQRKLLALAQITRTESESAEEAATAVKDLGSEALKKSAGKKAPAWLKAVTKGGTIASPEELIEASLRGTGGNLGELTGIYGQRGVKAFMRLAPLYNAAGGGDKGIAAVRAEMNPILNARGSQAQLDQQLAVVMNQPSEKLAKAFNELKETIASKAEPWIAKFAEKSGELVPILGSLIEKGMDLATFFASNPWAGVGAAIVGSIGGEVAKAEMGKLFERLLSTKLGGGFAIASAALTVGMATIELLSEAERQRSRADVASDIKGVNAASILSSDVRRGKVSAADIKAAEQEKTKLEEDLKLSKRGGVFDMSGIGSILDAVTGGLDSKNRAAEIKLKQESIRPAGRGAGEGSGNGRTPWRSGARGRPRQPGDRAPHRPAAHALAGACEALRRDGVHRHQDDQGA